MTVIESRRTCVGCGRGDAPGAFVRLVLGERGAVLVDAKGGAFGRGAHVHASPECISKACLRGLARSFKTSVTIDEAGLIKAIDEAYSRRVAGLLLAANRSNGLALGADAACEAMQAGAPLLVVATDAASITRNPTVALAIAERRAVVMSNKEELGVLLRGSQEESSRSLAVVAVRGSSIAREIQRACRLVDGVAVKLSFLGSDACKRREVR